MSDVGQVIAQMGLAGLPLLPANHPKLDGRFNRFGPKKKAWYILREMTLKSGRRVVTGAFGVFQGENRNTVPVTIDFSEMSEEDRTELAAKQRAYEAKEAEEKQQAAALAANRARDQWEKAQGGAVQHPYLERKQITPEGVRVSDEGLLLIPMMRAGRMVGLQKIDGAGEKLYNKGMDKIGAACALGTLAGAEVIGIGEGYATCRSARMGAATVAIDFPVVAAFDAGGILAVAQTLRRQYPQAHLLFLADDDFLLEHRLVERLREDFHISQPVTIDGAARAVTADDGEVWQVCAEWRKDKAGVDFIDVDLRKGRICKSLKYENAGLSRCTAAAREVGNASVALPLFQSRGARKLTDWNDLHVEESLDAVAAQLAGFILAAQQPKHASSVAQLAEPAVQAATQDDESHSSEVVGDVATPAAAASPPPSPDVCGAAGAEAGKKPTFALPP
ncbi:MAG: virulence protein E, partial [Burkholderiaceae bacterium]|nr:virulence protein E [Burkholderiaceae bacterium]